MSFRAWLRRYKSQVASWLSDAWLFLNLFYSVRAGAEVYVAVVSIPLPSNRLLRILTGPTMKVVGIIVALAVVAILGGLTFFNATQQKGIANSVSIVITVLPVILIVLFLSIIKRGR